MPFWRADDEDDDEMEPPRGSEDGGRRLRSDPEPKVNKYRCEEPGCGRVYEGRAAKMQLDNHMKHQHGDKKKGEGRGGGGGGPVAGVSVSYVTGKLSRLSKNLRRQRFQEPPDILDENVEDIADTLSELSKRNETTAFVVRLVLVLLGSGTALLAIGSFISALWREWGERRALKAAEAEQDRQRQMMGDAA